MIPNQGTLRPHHPPADRHNRRHGLFVRRASYRRRARRRPGLWSFSECETAGRWAALGRVVLRGRVWSVGAGGGWVGLVPVPGVPGGEGECPGFVPGVQALL